MFHNRLFTLNLKRKLKGCPENAPGKKAPQKKSPWEKSPFLFKLLIVTSFRSVSRTPAVSIIDLLVSVVITVVTNVKRSSCLDFAGVVYLPLSLLMKRLTFTNETEALNLVQFIIIIK